MKDTRPSLRERKKTRAMRHVHETALELAHHHGYSNVTIEQIAEVAEISPSSIYRYFGTKEGIFLWDQFDRLALEFLAETDPAVPAMQAMQQAVESLAGALAEAGESVRRQLLLIYTVPELKTATHRYLDELRQELATTIQHRQEPEVSEIESLVVAGALIGAIDAVMEHWATTGGQTDLVAEIERSLEILREMGA